MQELLFNNIEEDKLWFRVEGCKYYIVDTEAKLQRLSDILRNAKLISFDLETTGLSHIYKEIVGASICVEESVAYYIPFKHYSSNCISNEMFKSYLGELLQTKPILGHNVKFDYKFIKYKLDIDLNCKHDTYIITKLLDKFDFAGLKYLGEVIFGFNVRELEDIVKQYKITIDKLHHLKAEELFEYACQDVDLTLRLFKYFWEEEGWRPDYIYDLEIDLIFSLARMEMRGLRVDYNFLLELEKEYTNKIEESGNKIKKILELPSTFNIDSNIQLGRAFIEKFPAMKSKVSYTKSTKAVSLGEKDVKKYNVIFFKYLKSKGIHNKFNIFSIHLKRKKYFNLLTKYITSWIRMVEEERSNIIYTNINALGTDTGRMSSEKPNMQNVAPKIRHAIVPRDGYYFIALDYDQVEYRIFAGMAKLQHLADEMNKEKSDIHRIAASLLHGISEEEVSEELRKESKTLNFGVLYGMGSYKLAESLGITIEEADHLRYLYKKRFLRGTKWFKNVIKFAKANGYVMTAFGRKRRIDNINLTVDRLSSYADQKEAMRLIGEAKRKAINTPIQGTSADITKIGLNRVDNFIIKEKLNIYPVLVIHDEIVFEVGEEYAPEDIIPKLKKCMEMRFKNMVNLTVGANVSTKSWGALKDG